MDIIIWLVLFFIVMLLSIVYLSRGMAARMGKPNKELEEKVESLEKQVKQLKGKD
ncbi:hypothetical protein [Halobacillus sp. A5]|uniref:hypothetical protein n=1 Tax=Halobacillus sp. A5 TaxID=2880263 RepID=UPI0020A656C0|nr:hypothetical protein [Halobacillus sp. A5]MCP3028504.1 hypothetical protein [Halobacillus sp. A5]